MIIRNEMEMRSFCFWNLFWGVMCYLWFKNLLFQTIFSLGLAVSKLILVGIMIFTFGSNLLITRAKALNDREIGSNVLIPLGIYSLLSYYSYIPRIFFFVGLTCFVLAVVTLTMILGRPISKYLRRKRVIRRRFFLIYLVTPDADTLEARLRGRGTDTEESIKMRLDRANAEAEGIEKYDCVVVNEDIDECVKTIHQMIESEHYRTFRNKELISFLRADLKKFKL